MKLQVKRVYSGATRADGTRVLVDRIWPRGLRKEEAAVDLWLKEIAPSSELRKWFGHDPARWDAFKARYFAELDGKREPLRELAERARRGPVTLLFGAKDEEHNNAVALLDYLRRHSR